MKILVTLCILGLVFGGCSGMHCIKVGGTYGGVTGDLEYCYNAGKSSEVGTPVFENKEGSELIAVPKKELEEVADQLENKAGADVKTSSALTDHPYKRIKRILFELRK